MQEVSTASETAQHLLKQSLRRWDDLHCLLLLLQFAHRVAQCPGQQSQRHSKRALAPISAHVGDEREC
jgi:hypothetical protein